jgi:hypothetical protein
VTSTEVKSRWEAKTYKKYLVRLRVDEDAELIKYIDDNKTPDYGTSAIFKAGLEKLKNEGK